MSAGSILLGALNFGLIFIAFPRIEDSFDADPATISCVITSFSITGAALVVVAGWLADRIGRRTVFVTGLLTLSVGSICVAAAPSVEFLIFARVLQAAGIAISQSSALPIAIAVFPESRRSMVVGSYAAIGSLGASLAPILSGVITDSLSWRWGFALIGPVGLLVAVLGLVYLPDDGVRKSRDRPDFASTALVPLGVGSLALGIVKSEDWGWLGVETLISFAVALSVLALVVRRSTGHPSPIVDLSLYKVVSFRQGNVLSFIVIGSFGGTFLALVQFLTDVWELSLKRAGLYLAILTVIAGPMSFITGILADRYGHRRVILPGTVLMASGSFWFATQLGEDEAFLKVWLPGIVVYAVGAGLAHSASNALAMKRVPSDRLARGNGMNRIFQDIGSVISVAVSVALVAQADTTLEGVRNVMFFTMTVTLVAAAVSTTVDTRPETLARAEPRVGVAP